MAKPDVDLSEFFKYSKPKRRPCRVGFALDQLKPAQRAQLEAALATDAGIITGGAIVQWLNAREIDCSTTAVGNHRGKRCSCHD